MSYHIRPMAETDLEPLCHLYELCFAQQRSVEWLKNKFATGALGEQYVGFVAIAEGAADSDLAAFYGVFPLQMRIQGRVIQAAQSGDTMTHPAHRKQGLFVRLAQATFELARARGIGLIYGFPNAQSRRGFENLGWSFQAPLQVYEYTAKRPWWSRLKTVDDGAVRTRLRPYRAEVTALDFGGSSHVVQDANYLRYKQGYEPSAVYLFEDVVWWLKPGQRLDMGNVSLPDDLSDQALQEVFDNMLSVSGAKSMRFTYHPQSPLGKRLRKLCRSHAGQEPGYCLLDQQLVVDELYFSRGDFDFF